MTLFGGIDGGQTATVAVVGDANGLELGRGVGPAADLVGEARDSRRQAAALETALAAALASAGLASDAPFAVVVAGISGYDAGVSPVPDVRVVARRVRVVHDAEIAHAGALAGPGIVAIAGTGSVVLGNANAGGPLLRVGGWGAFFGDEGSAVALARRALRCAMRDEDAGRASALAALARDAFGRRSLRAIQHAFAHRELDYAAVAAFAIPLCALARAGDDVARREVAAAARDLAEQVGDLDRRLDPRPERRVAGVGGLFADDAFAAAFEAGCAAFDRVRVVAPVGDPASGALRLARETRPA